MEQELPPTICLDGASVRRIREEKKLTQLYVAKVVGVTTDTISRWENNRYPSIKRENALRLAEALEVPISEVLQGGTGECSIAEPDKRRYSLILPASVLAVILVLLAGAYFFRRHREVPASAVTADRLLPTYAAPGSVVPVRVRIKSSEKTRGYILRENFPRGWKLIEANPPASSLDNEEGMARWIVRSGQARKLIVYLLKADPKAEEGTEAFFTGEVVAKINGNNSPRPVEGTAGITIAPVHWADLNGDHLIDDGELLQASDTVDEMKGVHLDWDHLQAIWDAGGYFWDEKKRKFIAVKPPSDNPVKQSPSE